MSVKAYTGVSGSGKTYQVVSVVILDAVRKGRRVVSNIAGLHIDKMLEFLEEEREIRRRWAKILRVFFIKLKVPDNEFGSIVQVEHERVLEDDFFINDSDEKEGRQSFVQAGDLVVLDEVWRFWPLERAPLPPRHQNFFRMHRQLVHQETGETCDAVLISQSVGDINVNVRRNIEETYRATKDTAVGLDFSYSIAVYARASEAKSQEIRRFKGTYRKRFFPFYKSHAANANGVVPKEQNTDSRGNVLKGAMFKYFMPAMFILSIFSAFKIYGYLHQAEKGKPEVSAGQPGVPGQKAAPVFTGPAESAWRLVGYAGNPRVILLEREGVYRRVVDLRGYTLDAMHSDGMLNNQVVANWTGKSGTVASGLAQGVMK